MAAPGRDVTEGELAVLEVLWDRGPSAIRQVTDRLFPGGSTAQYATIQKQLERLEDKGFVARDRTLHVHLFSATVGRDELLGRRVRAVVDRLCGGSLVPLLSHLAQAHELTDAERRALRELVKKRDRATSPKRK